VIDLRLGDALDFIDQMPDGYLITDPPYGISYKSNHNTGSVRDAFTQHKRASNFAPIAGDDRPFDPSPWLGRFKTCAFFGANYFADRLPASRCWIVWDKLAGKTRSQQADCELIWANADKPARVYTHLWRGMIRAGEENLTNGPKLHPHQKPVALIRWLLDYLEVPADAWVIDPYMGSGSIGEACRQTGRNYYGVEISPEHFAVAQSRLGKAGVIRMDV
jgi:site-specific DNA-methyltransferase (adenine-specific)